MSLTIQHVTGSYGHLPVLKDINFEVHNGEMIGLIGLNGAGKSTTIKNIIGLLTPQKGTIAVDDLTLQQKIQRTIEKRSVIFLKHLHYMKN